MVAARGVLYMSASSPKLPLLLYWPTHFPETTMSYTPLERRRESDGQKVRNNKKSAAESQSEKSRALGQSCSFKESDSRSAYTFYGFFLWLCSTSPQALKKCTILVAIRGFLMTVITDHPKWVMFINYKMVYMVIYLQSISILWIGPW